MRKLLLFLTLSLSLLEAHSQFDAHGGYSLILERAISRKTTIMMHGGYIEAGYNFPLVESLGIRPALYFQMSQLTQNSVSALHTSDARSLATIVDQSNKEYDIQIPVHLNYSFDAAQQLHFNVFIGPSLGLVLNELKAIEFIDYKYKNAVNGNRAGFNIYMAMGFEFRFRNFGLRLAFNREMLSTCHKTKTIKRDGLQVGVSYRFRGGKRNE